MSAEPRTRAAPEAVAAALAAACQLVAGIALGGSFRLPMDVGPATRFTPSPVAAVLMGAAAAVVTFVGFRVAVAASRPRLAAALVALVGAVAAVVNAVISVTLVSAARSSYDLATSFVRTKQTLAAAYYMLPPGLFWSPVTVALLLVASAARSRPEDERSESALAFGAAALAATAEVALLVFRGRTMTTVTAVVAALVAVVALVNAARRAASGPGSRERALVGRALVALALAQVWVGAIYAYWRH